MVVYRYSVRVGEHDIQNDLDGNRHQDVLISNRISHEGFDSVSFQNDIAILKLARRVDFTRKCRFYCIFFLNLYSFEFIFDSS